MSSSDMTTTVFFFRHVLGSTWNHENNHENKNRAGFHEIMSKTKKNKNPENMKT